MQVIHFPNGGFVVHRITIGQTRYSAWYDRNGAMLDCERTYPSRQDVPLRNRLVRDALEAIGARNAPASV